MIRPMAKRKSIESGEKMKEEEKENLEQKEKSKYCDVCGCDPCDCLWGTDE